MARQEFNATFWDWAAFDLNWINIAAQERWMNGKGCPLDCNESSIDRLRDGLQVYLRANDPHAEIRLFDLLKILDKYRGDHKVPAAESDEDTGTVCRLVGEIMDAVPALKERQVSLQQWVDNGHERNIAIQTEKEPPAPILMPPAL